MSAIAYFAIRDDTLQGTGTKSDPFNGSTDVLLDAILANSSLVTADMTLVFGPGVFRTKGWSNQQPTWTVRHRQKLIGSGIDSTVLQLVKVQHDPTDNVKAVRVAIFSSGLQDAVEGVEISDMTLDVNLARQAKLTDGSNVPIVATGIGLNGSRITVRRVRVVGWGTYTKFNSDPVYSGECFPIYIEGKTGTGVSPGMNVVEDCIVEHPALSQARETTMLNNHTHWSHLNVFSTLRNNYCNGDYVGGTPELAVDVTSVTYASSVMTVATKWAHRLKVGDDLVIQGASVGAYNARFTVASVSADEKSLTIGIAGLPTAPTNSGIRIRRYVPAPMRVKAITYSGATITVETHEPHFRKAGEFVRVSGVKTGSAQDNNMFNGSFVVASVPTASKLTYAADSAPSAAPDAGSIMWLDRWPSQLVKILPLSFSWQLSGGAGLVRTGTQGPHYLAVNDWVQITGVSGDARWNGYFKVEGVPDSRTFRFVMPGTTQPPYPANSNAYATALLPQPFQALTATVAYGGRVSGNRVIGVGRGGPYHDLGPSAAMGNPVGINREKDCHAWNNYYYFVNAGPFSAVANRLPPETPPNYDDRQLWNVTHDNIVDLQPWPVGGWNEGPMSGIRYTGPFNTGTTYYPSIETAIVRDNIVRFVDWYQGPLPPPGYIQYGIDFRSVRYVVVDDNLVNMTMGGSLPAISYAQVDQPLPIYQRNNLSTNGTVLTAGAR